MRHWVNYGLLFSFLTLMASGILAFARPFSLITTRVHILFGLLTILLVILHVASRTRYFAAKTIGPKKTPGLLISVILVWGGLLGLAIWNTKPVDAIVSASYESRNKQAIVRQSALTGVVDIDTANRLVARLPDTDADTAVSLLVRLTDDSTPPLAVAIWAESSTGALIETLYLDSELAYSEEVNWQGIETRRHMLLPIWRHRYTLASGVDPTGEVDAFTAATPNHTFTLDNYLDAGGEDGFVLCVEVNTVRDPNDTYPDEKLGQPSLLYTAYIELNQERKCHLLELTAHSGGAEKSGSLQYDLDGIGSAKKLIDLLLAHVEPKRDKE